MDDANTKGWLPIVLCPTDGVDRALLLPDGREVVGAHHNPGGWRVGNYVEFEWPIYEQQPRGGLLPTDSQHVEPPEPERVQIGTRPAKMLVLGALPEGVYPTHFRPNDTVYGQPHLCPETSSNG